MTIQLFKTFSEGKPKETTINIPDCAQLITANSEKCGNLYYQECYGCCPNDSKLYEQFDSETSQDCVYLNDVILFSFRGLVNELISTKDFARFPQSIYMKLTDKDNDCEFSRIRYYKMIGIDELGIEVCQLNDERARFKPFLAIKRDSIAFDFLYDYDGEAIYITEEEFNSTLVTIKEKMKI